VETGAPLVVDVMPYEDVIDGTPVSGYYTVQASKHDDGVLVASRDITTLENSRRDLEGALRLLEETLQELEAAQRLAQLGTWRIDLATGALTMSAELRRRYDTGVEHPHRLDALAPWIHEDDAHLAREAFERAIRTRGPTVVEHRVRYADGATGYVRSHAQPVVVDDRVVEMWGTTQDITERVASRVAFATEHSRRLAAESLAAFGSELSGARTRQDVADAAHAVLRTSRASRLSCRVCAMDRSSSMTSRRWTVRAAIAAISSSVSSCAGSSKARGRRHPTASAPSDLPSAAVSGTTARLCVLLPSPSVMTAGNAARCSSRSAKSTRCSSRITRVIGVSVVIDVRR